MFVFSKVVALQRAYHCRMNYLVHELTDTQSKAQYAWRPLEESCHRTLLNFTSPAQAHHTSTVCTIKDNSYTNASWKKIFVGPCRTRVDNKNPLHLVPAEYVAAAVIPTSGTTWSMTRAVRLTFKSHMLCHCKAVLVLPL